MSYLQPQQLKHTPEIAIAMFSSREFYRQLVANLELMANWYNKVMKILLEVEFPLVAEELQNIDLHLQAAVEALNWKSEGNAPPWSLGQSRRWGGGGRGENSCPSKSCGHTNNYLVM